MVCMLFVTLFILSTTARQLHLSSFSSSLKTSWWRSNMKPHFKTCPGCWLWGNSVLFLYDVTVSSVLQCNSIGCQCLTKKPLPVEIWVSSSNMFPSSIGYSARQWVRDAAFDRTLFGLDTKILLPYLSMQYNHNALDMYIYTSIYTQYAQAS